MSNIDKFNEYVGRIFGELYESFPVPLTLSIGDILGHKDFATSGLPADMADEASIARHTIGWLTDAGYIYTAQKSDITYNQFYNLLLTSRGLETLKAIPVGINPSAPIGEQISSALKSGGKETLKMLIDKALDIGVKIITNNVT